MRGVGLLMVGLSLAACRGQGEEGPANVVAEQRAETASPMAPAPAQPEGDNSDVASEVDRVSPCLTQGAERLEVAPVRAVGTEPFWGARVQGRCVTYSTPENQQGVRLWTRYSEEPGGRAKWVGQLGGKPFELRTSPEADCSDGMSDRRYPLAVELLVDGEQRRGCAEPL
jgi:uncharacterized membrane protein